MRLLLTTLSLLTSAILAYQPGGIVPTVRNYINFSSNPFVQDPNYPLGFTQLPGYNGAIVAGNQFSSTSQSPGLFVSNQSYVVPGLGSEMEVKGTMAFQAELISGSILSPAGFDQDPLYGVAQLGVLDPSTGWLFALMETNTRIYGLYSRLPLAVTPINDYVAFAYLVPIAVREPHSSNQLSIVLNRSHFSVSYRVEGIERMYVERVGRPLDERFLLDDNGGIIQCMGFPESVYMIFGTGMLPTTGNPYTACQARNVFDQCINTLYDADDVQCDYQAKQPENTYNMGLTLTVEDLSLLQWAPNFDCRNLENLDVAAPLPEPLCFGGCPVVPNPLPPLTGCGLPEPFENCCSSSASHHHHRCSPIYRPCESSSLCPPSGCPIIYREEEEEDCGCHEPSPCHKPAHRRRRRRVQRTRPCKPRCSSSSSSNNVRRKPYHIRPKPCQSCPRKPCHSSSSSSSSSSHCKPRVVWGHRHGARRSEDRIQHCPHPVQRGPYCRRGKLAIEGLAEGEQQEAVSIFKTPADHIQVQ